MKKGMLPILFAFFTALAAGGTPMLEGTYVWTESHSAKDQDGAGIDTTSVTLVLDGNGRFEYRSDFKRPREKGTFRTEETLAGTYTLENGVLAFHPVSARRVRSGPDLPTPAETTAAPDDVASEARLQDLHRPWSYDGTADTVVSPTRRVFRR